MSLPVLQKTWQYNVNQIIGGTGTQSTDARSVYLAVKNSLKGFGSNPWTVSYSCNGTVAGTPGDGVDRWNTTADMPGYAGVGGPNHGWMILKQTGLGSNFQLLINHRNFTGSGTESRWYISISPSAGYTGGTPTTDPSATDEIILQQNADNSFTLAGAGKLHVMQSTDGQCTRIFWHVNTSCQGMILLEKPSLPSVAWTPLPYIACSITVDGSGAANSRPTYANFIAGASLAAKIGTVVFNPFITTEGINGTPLGQNLTSSNDVTGDYIMTPFGLASLTLATTRGRLGVVFDMWGGSTSNPEGTCYPGNATRQFIQFGNFIFPWNGSVPLIS